MQRYQPRIPRAALGLMAATMTAFTLAIAVVAPAHSDSSAMQSREVCAPQPAVRIAAHVDAASSSTGHA